jgi:hypothetical protein
VQFHCARPAKKKNRSLPPRRRTRPRRRPPQRRPRAPSTATASSPAAPDPTSHSSTSPPRPPPPPRPRTTAAPRPRPDLRSPPRRPTARSSASRSSAPTRPLRRVLGRRVLLVLLPGALACWHPRHWEHLQIQDGGAPERQDGTFFGRQEEDALFPGIFTTRGAGARKVPRSPYKVRWGIRFAAFLIGPSLFFGFWFFR